MGSGRGVPAAQTSLEPGENPTWQQQPWCQRGAPKEANTLGRNPIQPSIQPTARTPRNNPALRGFTSKVPTSQKRRIFGDSKGLGAGNEVAGSLPCLVRQGSPGRRECCRAWQAMEAAEQPHPPRGCSCHGDISDFGARLGRSGVYLPPTALWQLPPQKIIITIVVIIIKQLCSGGIHRDLLWALGARGERDGLLPVSPRSWGRGFLS